MNKLLFTETINALHKQYQTDERFSYHMGEMFPNTDPGTLLPDNHLLINQLISILQQLNGDTKLSPHGVTWIEYFINELNFGKNHVSGCAQINNTPIDISTPESLYDFLLIINTKY